MASGLLSGAGGAAYSQSCANDLRIERSDLKLYRWRANGFRLAVLADFHMNTAAEARRALEAVGMAVSLKPDAIALVGDFVDSTGPRVLPNVRKVLGELGSGNCPVLAVMGNHDYWTRSPSNLIEEIRSCGIKVLRNEPAEVRGVTFAGVDDAIAGRDRYDFFEPHKVSESCIVMVHEPDTNVKVPMHASLQVSGHSHGGQICLPLGIPVHTPGGAKRFRSGYYSDPAVPIYVTRGVGTTGPNFRLFCPPEVTLLTLSAA